ncbi:MAG TPA: hypothetical protein VF185_01140 [Patescibacteria group bacterium]
MPGKEHANTIPEAVRIYLGIKSRAYHESQTPKNHDALIRARKIVHDFQIGEGSMSIVSELMKEMPEYYPPLDKK